MGTTTTTTTTTITTSIALTASETQAPTEWIPTSAPGVKTRGILTMWSTQQALIGAQCEYANAPVGSVSDPVLSPYLRSGYHCAIGDSNPGFGRGEHCGKCYRITSLNDDGTHGTPGNKGSAVVTVSDGGAGGPAHFDCILEGFEAITGATTGVFDVDFEEVLCEDVTASPVIINWAARSVVHQERKRPSRVHARVPGRGSLAGVVLAQRISVAHRLRVYAFQASALQREYTNLSYVCPFLIQTLC